MYLLHETGRNWTVYIKCYQINQEEKIQAEKQKSFLSPEHGSGVQNIFIPATKKHGNVYGAANEFPNYFVGAIFYVLCSIKLKWCNVLVVEHDFHVLLTNCL